jgi:hypothetical protein
MFIALFAVLFGSFVLIRAGGLQGFREQYRNQSHITITPLVMGGSEEITLLFLYVDQTCARQERELRAFVKKAGYKVVGVWKETASGAKQERAERKKVLALAQARKA